MKKYVFSFIAVCAVIMAVVTGCDFLKNHSAEIHQTVAVVLQNAYENGGSEKVSAKIDTLVADGKLSKEQAEKLKASLQKNYDAMQKQLAELSVKDIPVKKKTE